MRPFFTQHAGERAFVQRSQTEEGHEHPYQEPVRPDSVPPLRTTVLPDRLPSLKAQASGQAQQVLGRAVLTGVAPAE